MIEWLNHANPWLDPRPWLLVLGLLPLAGAVLLTLRVRGFRHAERDEYHVWLVLLAAGTLGWVAGGVTVNAANRWAMPPPECLRPQPCVVIDRATSTVPLAEGMFPKGDDKGYGMLEAWIPRVGCHTVRKEGDDVFSGDALVAICPSRLPPEEFRGQYVRRLMQYVRRGGKLLVIDSWDNNQSTADALLRPFGLSILHNEVWKGRLSVAGQASVSDADGACEVAGGEPLARIDKVPVAAAVHYGKGLVMAVGLGSLWNDTRMGGHWMQEPSPAVRARYEVLFSLLRTLLAGKAPSATTPPTSTKPAEELPLKESGPAEL